MTFDLNLILRNLPALAHGAAMTLLIVLCALAIGIPGGITVCALERHRNGALRAFGRIYVNVFRNTPEVVVIFWVYYCLPQILGLRMSGFTTGVLALGMAGAAFMAEIFRAGIEAVPRAQSEAAQALGLPPLVRWAFVVLPQALRVMLPNLLNYLIELMKHSTLLSAIGVAELAHAAFAIGGQTFRYFEFFTAIGIFFLAMILPISLLERRSVRRLNAPRLKSTPV